jgi:uncharacterized protein
MFAFVGIHATDTDKLPQLRAYVTDDSNFLNSSERNSLEAELKNFQQETSNEIVVYISDNLYGMAVEEFAFALGEKNGIGKKGVNNGVLIVVKPKTTLERGRVFIATGYGLEGAIPDAIVNRIVNAEILPQFKNGNNYAGLKSGIDVLKQLAKGEIDEKQYMNSKSEGNWVGVLMILLIVFVVFISNARKARRYGRRNNLPFWAAMAMLNSSSGSSSSGFSNFSSGSGSFGGFGGGSFGGGGAGGSW